MGVVNKRRVKNNDIKRNNKKKKTKVLITGATGFLGRNVIELLRKDYEIIATDLPTADFSGIAEFCAKIIPSDLTRDNLLTLVSGVDVVVNIAGLFDLSAPPEKLYLVNVDAVERLAKASLKTGVPLFIHISSTGVYGKPERIPCDEDTPPKPRNPYEKSKKAGEDVVLLYTKKGLPAVVLRPTLIYGPYSMYGYAMLIGLFSLAKELGKKRFPSIKNGPWTHSVHVYDVAEAIRLVIEKWREGGAESLYGEVFNVADDTPLRYSDMLSTIAGAVGVELNPVIPYPIARVLTLLISHSPFYEDLKEKALSAWDRLQKEKGMSSPLRPRLDEEWNDYFSGDFMYSTQKIKKYIGFKPKFSFEEGIKYTVRWYRERKWIF